MNTKNLVLAFLIILSMTLTIFIITPIRSSPTTGTFNPWADLNGDGTVDIYDAIQFAGAFGSSGQAINTSQIALPGFMSKPAYDTGWQSISPGQDIRFYHYLNTTDLFVYMMGKDASSTHFLNQVNYGQIYGGANWGNLTSEYLDVYRGYQETWYWDQVRIVIWKLP